MCRKLVTIALLLALSGCLSHKRISDIGAQPSGAPAAQGTPWAIPAGVVVTAAQHGERNIDGLYPSTVPNDRTCCWIATQARISTDKPASATWLDLTVFVPDYKFFRTHTQSLNVALDDEAHIYGALFPGVHTLRLDLPKELQKRSGPLELQLRTQYAFIPEREHMSSDTRSLGIILLRVDYGK